MADPIDIKIQGLREVRKALDVPARKILREELADGVRPIASDARGFAPRGDQPLRKRDQHIADTIRPYVSGSRISIGSSHPGAGVLNFGGTIRPRGVPIHFEARDFVGRAIDRHSDDIVDAIGDAIERAFARL